MKNSIPIRPSDLTLTDNEVMVNLAVDYINDKLIKRQWHEQISKVNGYRAISLSPYGVYIEVMDLVVEMFQDSGWDCKWAEAYDARGYHNCFYVSEKHFESLI